MKKVLLSTAIALFAVSTFAQSGSTSDVREKYAKKTKKETTLDGKENSRVSADVSKAKSESDYRQDDLNKKAKLSREEKVARKTAKKAKGKIRKADRMDDGIVNGSAGDNNDHGKNVSGVARGTTLEGREKGETVSNVARSKSRNGESVNRKVTNKKPNRVVKPAGSGKSSGVRRPMGAEHKGHK